MMKTIVYTFFFYIFLHSFPIDFAHNITLAFSLQSFSSNVLKNNCIAQSTKSEFEI